MYIHNEIFLQTLLFHLQRSSHWPPESRHPKNESKGHLTGLQIPMKNRSKAKWQVWSTYRVVFFTGPALKVLSVEDGKIPTKKRKAKVCPRKCKVTTSTFTFYRTHLVAKFGTNSSGAIWWPNFELMLPCGHWIYFKSQESISWSVVPLALRALYLNTQMLTCPQKLTIWFS